VISKSCTIALQRFDFSTCFVVVFFARTDIDSDIFDYFSFFLAEIESLKSELATSEKVADLVTENSEIPYMDAFFTENARTDIDSDIFDYFSFFLLEQLLTLIVQLFDITLAFW